MLPKINRRHACCWMGWGLAVGIGFASAAPAQVPTRERSTGALRPVSPSGVVVAITPEAVTIKSRGGETEFQLDRAAILHRLAPIRLTDITEPRWATVYREPNRGQTDEVTVAWARIEAMATGEAGRGIKTGDAPLPPSAMRPSLTGTLGVEGAKVTLECDDRALSLKCTERTRIYEAVPATLDDVKVGSDVVLDWRVTNGAFVARGIDILPAGESLTVNAGKRTEAGSTGVRLALSPAKERVLPCSAPCRMQFIQFRTGDVIAIGDGPGDTSDHAEDYQRAEESGGLDASVIGGRDGIQLVGRGCVFTRDKAPNWETMTADEVITSLRRESWLNGVVEIKGKEFPATFLFKTANGDCGLLRILGVTEDDRGWNRFGMQFHYKLVESRTNQPAQR